MVKKVWYYFSRYRYSSAHLCEICGKQFSPRSCRLHRSACALRRCCLGWNPSDKNHSFVLMAGPNKNSATNGGYDSERISIPTEFEKVFSHLYTAQNNTAEPIHKTLLPSFQTIMVFSFGSGIQFSTSQGNVLEIEKAMVIGPIKQPINYTLAPGADIFVVNFKSDGFYRFFGQAVISAQYPVHPDELLEENCFSKLWSVLQGLNTSSRVELILEFAKPYLRDRDRTIANLEDHLDVNVNIVKAMANETGQSERSIQLKHKKYLGYSAKEIARYQRFLTSIEFIEKKLSERDQTIDWQECVDKFGYYDQSQLIHDFKFYLNLSPKQYLRFQQDICIAQPS